MGLGALTGARARKAMGELGAASRSLYDTAALTGNTCRLVFLLPKDDSAEFTYRAECANGPVTTSMDRDQEIRDATKAAVEAYRKRGRGPTRRRRALRPPTRAPRAPRLLDVLDSEKARVEKAAAFSAFTTPEIQPRKMRGVRVSVWTCAPEGEDRQRPRLPLLLPPGLHRARAGHGAPGQERLDAARVSPHRQDLDRRRRAGGPEVMRRALHPARGRGRARHPRARADGHLRPQLRRRGQPRLRQAAHRRDHARPLEDDRPRAGALRQGLRRRRPRDRRRLPRRGLGGLHLEGADPRPAHDRRLARQAHRRRSSTSRPGKDGISGLAALLGSGRDGGRRRGRRNLAVSRPSLANMVPQAGTLAGPASGSHAGLGARRARPLGRARPDAR